MWLGGWEPGEILWGDSSDTYEQAWDGSSARSVPCPLTDNAYEKCLRAREGVRLKQKTEPRHLPLPCLKQSTNHKIRVGREGKKEAHVEIGPVFPPSLLVPPTSH